MYILSFAPILFVFYTVYSYCCKNTKKNIKKFDDNQPDLYEFELYNTIFFHDTTELHRIDYSNSVKFYDKETKIPLNYEFACEYFVVTYNYNYVEYKLLTKPKELSFPIYMPDQLKQYVYTNCIKEATLYQLDKNYNNKESVMDNFIIQTYNILDDLLPFLGPNYNFYEDLNIEIDIKNFVNYLYAKDPLMFSESDLSNSKFHIELCDTFSNIIILNDKLKWNPVLQL